MISIGSSFRQGLAESRHRDVNQRGIGILGYWTPAIPAGVTDHFDLT